MHSLSLGVMVVSSAALVSVSFRLEGFPVVVFFGRGAQIILSLLGILVLCEGFGSIFGFGMW